jgi:hypothetical protein
MTTESGDANSAVFKFFLPRFGFGSVGDEIVEVAMGIVGIAPCADFHGFETEGGDLVEHGVKRKMIVDRIEDADGNLSQVARRLGRVGAAKRGIRNWGARDQFTAGNRGRQQTARASQKFSPADGGVLGLPLHARHLDERSIVASTNKPAALYASGTRKQASKIGFLAGWCEWRETKEA